MDMKRFLLQAIGALTITTILTAAAFAGQARAWDRAETPVRAAGGSVQDERSEIARTVVSPLRNALEDLARGFPGHSSGVQAFQAQLAQLDARLSNAQTVRQIERLRAELEALQREALVMNPLVCNRPILFVVRRQYGYEHHNTETMSQNGELGGGFRPGGALKTIHFGNGGEVRTLLEVPEGVIRDPEVDFSGTKIIFSMRKDTNDEFHICEMDADGSGLRQLTFGRGLSDIDPMYLPDGRIVFGSTREPKYCQCNRHIMVNLFKMERDGANIHQIGRNILFEGHPSLMPDGRILYDRWEYVDKHFGPAFGLWTVNPDGTNHAVYYGNNAWSPGAIIDARVIPGTRKFVATFGSCHDKPWGAIAIVDRTRGLDGIEPVVHSWPADISRYLSNNRDYERGRDRRGHPMGGQIDNFARLKVKYEDPYPLSETHFLCSRMIEGEEMGLFLLDVFGNEVLLHREAPGCFDPMPVAPRDRPPTLAPQIDLAKREGLFYVKDVYTGTGMETVERGSARWLRVVEAPAKLFWCGGNWNIDATQAPAMNWNSTNNKRILGKVPVEADGSAYFRVPADTFVFFQLLDENDMMIQSMRSGTMVRPGETVGCVGCHENRLETVANGKVPLAVRRSASRIEPWYGPPRDFNYLTEVQPVFDKHCVSCHDYGKEDGQALNFAPDPGLAFNTSYVELRSKSPIRWYPDAPDAEKVLVKAVDDGPPEVLPAYSWGSHRSRLVDVIREKHYEVKLNKEELDRIVTWIDLNAPYYGSYATAYPDHAFGRSPLDNQQINRLRQLTGVNVGDQGLEMTGSQVSFARPECSPCLVKFEDKDDPDYLEALAIIRAGQGILAAVSRADLPGARLVGIDRKRQEKYETFAKAESKAREALVKGEKTFWTDSGGE